MAEQRMEFRFRIGQRVVHALHHARDHKGWLGVVCGREFYEDQDGRGQWYYVRWIEPDGKVGGDKLRMPDMELVPDPS